MPGHSLRLVVYAALVLAVTALGCGTTSGNSPADSTTASYAATLGDDCASTHDCAANQRCVARRCELAENACLSHNQCGSSRCEAGFCAIPSPALLVDLSKSRQPTPRDYLRAGNDGLVDARGGLVLALGSKLERRGEGVRWNEFTLRGWAARGTSRETWAPLSNEPRDAPERFVFEHGPTGATLVAYVRPITAQDQRETLAVHAGRLKAALERGLSLADAVTLDTRIVEALPLENERLDADRIEALQAVRLEGQRRLASGADRLRVYVARLHFGTQDFVVYVGLSAPIDSYADLLDELGELTGAVRFGGIDAGVAAGL